MAKIIFKHSGGTTVEVDDTPGQSLMEVAVRHGITGIEAECGGSMSCATCHCYVDEAWFGATGAPSQEEGEMLEFAEKPMQPTSRLSCQVTITDALDGLVVEVP